MSNHAPAHTHTSVCFTWSPRFSASCASVRRNRSLSHVSNRTHNHVRCTRSNRRAHQAHSMSPDAYDPTPNHEMQTQGGRRRNAIPDLILEHPKIIVVWKQFKHLKHAFETIEKHTWKLLRSYINIRIKTHATSEILKNILLQRASKITITSFDLVLQCSY